MRRVPIVVTLQGTSRGCKSMCWPQPCTGHEGQKRLAVQGSGNTFRHGNETRRDQEPGLRAAYGLCQQMTHFFHQLRLYITFEVIEPAWLHMNARMKAAKTLDEVIRFTQAPCCTQTHACWQIRFYPQPGHILDVLCHPILRACCHT